MRVERDGSGDVHLRGLTILDADTLLAIPDLLESDDPAVRERLYPTCYSGDEEAEAQWRRFQVPELEHLFASRCEIVRKDLTGMAPDDTGEHSSRSGGPAFRLRIPSRHLPAWQSAINGASHAQFLLAGLRPEDMEREIWFGPGVDPEREMALLRVRILGSVLALLLELEGYGFPDDLTPPPEDP